MAQPNTSRRDLLRLGTSAAAYAAGAAVDAGGTALASEAKAASTSTLTALIARYHAANKAYGHMCETVFEPAEARLDAAVEAAKENVPHVTMTFDMSWSDWSNTPTKTYTTADRVSVICAQVTAETPREPAHLWSDDQHRHFAEVRRFHEARLVRDAEVAAAVKSAKEAHRDGADTALEEALWGAVSDSGSAVVSHQPQTIAELSAKLAFYAETSFLPEEALLEHVTADVRRLAGEA